MAKNKTKKTWMDKYDAEKEAIGAGGNGTVSIVKDKKTGEKYALKELTMNQKEKRSRFCEEIDIMYENYAEIDGIMPIYDYSKDELWYVMPLAKLLMEYIKEECISFKERIDIITEYASILTNIHEKDISHRDIKPLNLYVLNGKYFFGDFGLASFPEHNHDFTKSDRGVGAIFTIAPEMKRNPKNADGKKADVYSFAKTMWMILTLDEKGFEGQYNRNDQTMALSQINDYKNIHLFELEELLSRSTSNDPNQRPDMRQVLECLKEYKQVLDDFDSAQKSDWKNLSKQIFGDYEPSSCTWTNIDDIIKILNTIGKSPAYNHMFFSSKGGQDFEKAQKANEEGCIEIYAGGMFPNIVKPQNLVFEGFGNEYAWNYFLLELEELPAKDADKWANCEYEVLIEDYPAHYVSADYAVYGVYDYDTGEKLPEGWKKVARYKKGKLLFAFTFGNYNAIRATYDGRHGMCSSQEFKMYIQKMISEEHRLKGEKKNVKAELNRLFNDNPFEKMVPSTLNNN